MSVASRKLRNQDRRSVASQRIKRSFFENPLQSICQTFRGELWWMKNQISPKTTMWIIKKSTLRAHPEATYIVSTPASKTAHLEDERQEWELMFTRYSNVHTYAEEGTAKCLDVLIDQILMALWGATLVTPTLQNSKVLCSQKGLLSCSHLRNSLYVNM